MKTGHLKRGRNMSRIDFGWCIFENIKELFLFVFLRAWARACVRSLYSCVRRFVLAYTGLFLRLCVRGNGPEYAGSCLCTWALTRICDMFGKSSTLPIFVYFSSVSLPCAILTHLFVIFFICISLHPLFIFILASKHHIFQILLESGI